MVPLIKNKIASVEDVAHLSLSPARRVAEHCTQSLRNAVVPRAKSSPHINLVAEGPSISSPHLSSQAFPATSLTGQTTVASTVLAKPARSPEFSDEESQHESDNFSFHFSQDEEWTDEVEARMQNAIDRMLEDARRQLAEPVLNFSVLFPDDLLADSVAHQTAANPRTSRSGALSQGDYGDQEDETEEDDGLVVDNVWEELVTARPLTPIPEESLADKFVVEEDAHSPPLSSKHAMSPSSTPSMCETISVHEEECQHQRIRRVTGCIDLRKAVGGSDVSIETYPSLSMVPDLALRRKRQRWVDLEEGLKVEITTKSSVEPPIPPRPPDVYLRQRRRRWKPPDPY